MDQLGLFRLPLEIREAIWKECLPDPASSPGIYFYNRAHFGPDQASAKDSEPGGYARFRVVIDYPVILHVCHESREYAWTTHGISFQQFPRKAGPLRVWAPYSHVLKPCRPYRPETDVFFYSEDNISDLWEVSDRRRNDPIGVFGSIRYFALGTWHFMDELAIEFWLKFMCTLPCLRNVSLVFGYHWGFFGVSDDKLEFRHFSLVPFVKETAWVYPGFEEDIQDLELAPVRVTNFLEELKYILSAMEVMDKTHAPWDEESDMWLFSFSAETMVDNSI
ncbi:hypothetical protein VM1G_00103 [Cytospora mali]|uniref:2EXR domain-containing protein n=1 Tax=Cytospora mali TaxID=578113 RepID=A0A194VLH1_CYTMA|nr:hypothetical protein VM1G_00103 [Valsa mali]